LSEPPEIVGVIVIDSCPQTDHGGEGTGHGNQYDLPQTRYVWSILRRPDLATSTELPLVNSVDLLPTMLNWLNIPVQSSWNLDGVVLF